MLKKKCSCGRGDFHPLTLVTNSEMVGSQQCNWYRPIQIVFSKEPKEHIGVE